MAFESFPRGCFLLRLALALAGFSTVSGIAVAAEPGQESQPVDAFEIPAWAFDRGNARVFANEHQYADYRDTYPELVVGDSGRTPWVVEYDVDFPVDASYTVNIRYVSTEPRSLTLSLDDRGFGTCCTEVTGVSIPQPYRRPKMNNDPPPPGSGRVGAQWDEAGRLLISQGRHTLRLTSQAPPPCVIAIRLESPVAFPKEYKPIVPAERVKPGATGHSICYESSWEGADLTRKIERIPPVQRTAFLPPGTVNVAALRMAIEDVIAEYGLQYPKGPAYLKRLAELEEKRSTIGDRMSDQARSIEQSLGTLRRDAMLDHPLLNFDKLLLVKRFTLGSSHIYSDHWDGSRTMGGNLCILSPVAPDGKVTEIAPQLSGGLFGRFDLSYDGKKVVFAYKRSDSDGYRIHEIGIDGTDLSQLTFDAPEEPELAAHYGDHFRYEDCDPCYLPDGNILFTSTRSQRRVFCFGSTVSSLYLMDGDGRNVRCVSAGPVNEIAPTVRDDGQVIYTRWEYVDKGFGNVQSLWSMRPDGSGSAHVYKNDLIMPAGLINASSIPGSNRLVTIAAPHCGLSVGPVLLVDNRENRRTASGMTNITPQLGFPGMGHHPNAKTFGYFKEPYPLSEKLFLVAHNPHEKDCEPTGYGIYVLDAWGNQAELYRDEHISCFQPTPLRPRRRPTQVASIIGTDVAKAKEPATLFLQDVYEGLTGIPRGRVKYLRVMEAIGVSWDDGWRAGQQGDTAGLQASAVSLGADVNIKKVHGIAKVHQDGSAHFLVPAEKNLFFQALDENYMELQRMRTFVNLRPGEQRSCIGCHELRRKAPCLTRAHPMAMAKIAQALTPQPGDSGPRTVHYARDIRPILDRHCVRCHGEHDPKGDLDLSGGLTKLYDRSYENLIDRELVAYLNDGYGSANVAPETPLSFGSHRSRLVEQIQREPCRSGLTHAEFIRIVTWIDANIPYYGTHRGKKNVKWESDPDFRPMPLVGK